MTDVAGSASGSFASASRKFRHLAVSRFQASLIASFSRSPARWYASGVRPSRSRPPATRCKRSAGRIAPSVRTVTNGFCRFVCIGRRRFGSELGQVDVDAQHVGRELRLDPLADAPLTSGLADPAVGVEQLLAAPAGDVLQVRAQQLVPVDDPADEVGRLLGRDVRLGLGVGQPCGGRVVEPLGVLGEPAKARVWQSSASSGVSPPSAVWVTMW